ncbi:MAG: hypothetical protein PHN37_00990 [Candidatus Pacebacteria bacterium]|jgi:hypothetical protein|nr:hypothetical protein [Candidatus Paceibacterota bacterium]
MIFSFYFKRPALIITSDEKIKKFILKINSKILILNPIKRIKFFIKYSRLSISISSFETKELRSFLPPRSYLILNYDKESFGREVLANIVSYGFEKGSDFLITDLNFLDKEVNFKINYKGSTIPFWIKNIKEKQDVYFVVAAIVANVCLGLNLVEISKKLSN